jgi:adenylyltransferase/sulfurtransferase
VGARELKERLERGEPLTIIDVREPHEWEIANLGTEGARLIPLGQLEQRMNELDSADEIVLHCRSGSRSARALRQLRAAGFRKLYNLRGGILAWADEVDEEMSKY